jgi:hypothetical protein
MLGPHYPHTLPIVGLILLVSLGLALHAVGINGIGLIVAFLLFLIPAYTMVALVICAAAETPEWAAHLLALSAAAGMSWWLVS